MTLSGLTRVGVGALVRPHRVAAHAVGRGLSYLAGHGEWVGRALAGGLAPDRGDVVPDFVCPACGFALYGVVPARPEMPACPGCSTTLGPRTVDRRPRTPRREAV